MGNGRRSCFVLTIGLLVGALVACTNDPAPKSENSGPQTQLPRIQVSQSESTPPPAPTAEIAEFCRALREYRLKRETLIDRFNEINATDDYFGSVTQSELQELLNLEDAARSVHVVPPPVGGSDRTSRMNALFVTVKAADQRFVDAIRTHDYAAHQSAREEANAAAEELHQLLDSTCP